jgi:hypothetical protein
MEAVEPLSCPGDLRESVSFDPRNVKRREKHVEAYIFARADIERHDVASVEHRKGVFADMLTDLSDGDVFARPVVARQLPVLSDLLVLR